MLRSLSLAFLLAGACLVPAPAAAQVVAPGYVHDAWTNAAGLPVNTVNAIVQDRDGYLWLATFDGLIRFDGHTFTVFNTVNTPGLPSNRISHLLQDPDGRLWFSAGNGSVGYWHDGRVTALDPERLGQGRLRALAQAADGTIWLNTTSGIYRVRGDRLQLVWNAPGLPFNTFVHPMADGSVWIVPNDAAAAAVHVTARDTTTFTTALLGEVFGFYEDPVEAGVVWISTSKGGYRYAQGRGAWFTTVPDMRQFFRDAGGRLYAGTLYRLYRFDEGRPTLVFEGRPQNEMIAAYWHAFQIHGVPWIAGPDRLLHEGRTVFHLGEAQTEIRQVLPDREGNLWIATLRKGLHRLRPSLFTTYGMAEGLASANVYAVREEAPGTMWIGTQGGGLARLRTAGDGRPDVRVWQRPDGVPYLVYDVLPRRDGGLWVGGGMLAWSPSPDDPAFAPAYTARLGIAETVSDIRALYEDPGGCLWMGSAAVLYRTCAGRLDRFTVADGLPHNTVITFLEAHDGTLWMATNGGGLAAYRDGRFTALTTADGLSSNNIRTLYQDAEGILWVGTEDGGLNRIVLRDDAPTQAAHITRYREADGLFAEGIHTILEDDFGRFWMSSNRGLFWVTRAGLDAFAAGRERRIFSVGYDESDGLRDREANGGTQSPGVKASDGRLWFATQAGAVVVDPAEVRPEIEAVPTYIEAVEAESLFAPPYGTAAVRLPRGVRDFDVRYTGLHFTKPQSVRFRYRLNAGEWVEAGARRTAFYTNVAPGTYTFEVIASAYPGQWPARGATVVLTVPPFFYETGWFRALALLLLMAGLAGVYGGRMRHLRQRAQELDALVKARTAELRAEQTRTEEALEQVRRQAEQLRSLDAAKSRFFANISHEFRTPLTLTLGPLEDLQDGAFSPLPGDVQEQVQLAHRNAQRLLRLINQLLDLSRLESGTIRLERKPVELGALLRGIAGAFAALAERKALAFTLALPDEAAHTEGDPARLEEVFVNLVGNAFKFTPDGGRIDVRLEAAGDVCRVVVADTGTGIDPEDLPHVFERFYQGRRGQHPSTPGTGIGLALSHELVQLHGGTLAVTSTPGAGSRFTVTLPRSDAGALAAPVPGEVEDSTPAVPCPGEALPVPPHPTDATAPDEDRTTVLLVDDHPEIRAYVRRHLQPAYHVIEAPDGTTGLHLARTHLPDLIVADVMMPGVDGYDLCRAVKTDAALGFIPVILLTGRAAAEDRLAGLDEGADDYLTKPFDVPELRARIDNLIRQRRRLRAMLHAAPPPGPADDGPPSADAAFVERVRGVVHAHLADETLNVEVLAGEVGLSRTQLYRRLKALTGQTPTDFIRTVRLAEAAHLLAHQAGTVSEVAYGVGFNSIAHFSRAFRAAYGMPPSEYAAQPGDAAPETT